MADLITIVGKSEIFRGIPDKLANSRNPSVMPVFAPNYEKLEQPQGDLLFVAQNQFILPVQEAHGDLREMTFLATGFANFRDIVRDGSEKGKHKLDVTYGGSAYAFLDRLIEIALKNPCYEPVKVNKTIGNIGRAYGGAIKWVADELYVGEDAHNALREQFAKNLEKL